MKTENTWKNIKRIDSSQKTVSKYVFESVAGDAVVESVLYKYPSFIERTVICCSTQSGCPVGCRFCLTPNQLVNTNNGEVYIQELKRGDVVIGPSGHNEIVDVLTRNYIGEIIKFTLENGKTIEVTSDHPMILKNGLIKNAGEITESDELLDANICQQEKGQPEI